MKTKQIAFGLHWKLMVIGLVHKYFAKDNNENPLVFDIKVSILFASMTC